MSICYLTTLEDRLAQSPHPWASLLQVARRCIQVTLRLSVALSFFEYLPTFYLIYSHNNSGREVEEGDININICRLQN